jgi:hypothetical protein
MHPHKMAKMANARSGLLISMATWVGNLDPFEKKNLEFLE